MRWIDRILGVAAIGALLAGISHMGDHPKRTIVVVPVMMESGGTLIPADPETGASDDPSAPFQTRRL